MYDRRNVMIGLDGKPIKKCDVLTRGREKLVRNSEPIRTEKNKSSHFKISGERRNIFDVLFSKKMAATDNIRVAIRVRPLIKR